MINLGEVLELKIMRLSDLGYMLSDGKEDVLLHFNQAKCEHNIGDTVKVFIYADKAKRLTATESMPFIDSEHANFVKVVNVIKGMGVFVDINTPKDVLIEKDNLPYDEDLWPIVGDMIFARLKIKDDSFVAKPLSRFDIKSLHKNVGYADNEIVNATVIRVGEKGLSMITNDPMYIFVPKHQYRGNKRMGEVIPVTITKRIDDEYYGKLNLNKENLIEPDKELILNYIKDHHGKMKITEKSPSELIVKEFGMSKKAFKRAYGGLYKDRLIDFNEEETFIVKK